MPDDLTAVLNDMTPIDVIAAIGMIGGITSNLLMLGAMLGDALDAFAQQASDVVTDA